ncbi:hypothetical protein PGTUg99_019041 [Puccinia graminis f. sp. tritici]|uniref:Uncharacterized protein n=1 Tax=Puccinia graminis f. sp. tritici TaxID=56615 RepID=A0A5B0Q1J6_PUCGR|nr:hypothetical protein PGTUg99_019041 [Puccinia graminis f. sp. tritici]
MEGLHRTRLLGKTKDKENWLHSYKLKQVCLWFIFSIPSAAAGASYIWYMCSFANFNLSFIHSPSSSSSSSVRKSDWLAKQIEAKTEETGKPLPLRAPSSSPSSTCWVFACESTTLHIDPAGIGFSLRQTRTLHPSNQS